MDISASGAARRISSLDFLHSIECETFYFVGDIIDVWELNRRVYWPQAHNNVIRAILRKAKNSARRKAGAFAQNGADDVRISSPLSFLPCRSHDRDTPTPQTCTRLLKSFLGFLKERAMVSLLQLWLPILLSAIVVFIVSGVLHMALKFWHRRDDHGFSNEDEVAAAVRRGTSGAGMYMLPFCTAENANSPEMKRKLAEGPVGVLFLRGANAAGMGSALGQWFVHVVVVTLFAAYVATLALSSSAADMQVFNVVGVVTFMAYSLGAIPYGIWFGQPWGSVVKHVADGLIYAVITGALFAWLWPSAAS